MNYEECVDGPLMTVLDEASEVKLAAPQGASSLQPTLGLASAVCVDVIDLGLVNTEWGAKPKLKFVFELGEMKANGYPASASRTFTKSLHEKSALRPALESWLGRTMNEQELTKGFTYSKLNGKSCTLTVLPALSGDGHGYNKIAAITPAGEVALKPSGTYRRWTNN